MLDSISRTIGSGDVKYDLTIGFSGMDIEQIQADAVSFYAWKVQRTIREGSDADRADYAENGINLHAT